MSIAIKGLAPPADFIPAGITLDYLEKEDPQITRWIYHFFADLVQKYSARARLNTYVHTVYPPALRFNDSDLTRYMSSEQKDKMRQCDLTTEKVNGFIQQLLRRGGIAKIAADLPNYAQYPTLALAAHMLGGDVTQEQVVSTCLLYHAIEQFIKEPHFVQLYQHSEMHYEVFLNKRKINDFVPSFRTISIFTDSTYIQRFFNLNNLQKNALLKRLKSKPDSEHYYHTIALPLGPIASPGHLLVSRNLNRFKPVSIGKDPVYKLDRSVIVIPSFSMLQEYAYVLYGDDTMPLSPLIGVCTKKEIEHFKMQDKCVFQVGTREAPLPVHADGQHFGKFSRALHDAYHRERGCWIGKTGRSVVRYIVGHIFKSANDPQTRTLIWILLDGELWEKEENFAHLFTDSGASWTDTQKRAVIRNMALLAPFWDHEFDITPEQLLPTEKSLYDAIAAEITPEERRAAESALFQYYITLPEKTMETHFLLGWLYYAGYGTAVSQRSAIEHWTLCGHAQALYNIAHVYNAEPNHPLHRERVYSHCLAAAEKGHRQAQFEIGWWYYSAHAFVNFEKRLDLAWDFFKRAAAQDHPVALFTLGIMYRDGEGVPINLDDAFTCFKRAADLGSASAQCEIGIWYHTGLRILPRDFTEARRYFQLAAEQNHPVACHALGFYYAKGLGGSKDLLLAYTYLKKSAELGHQPAIQMLKTTLPPKQKKRPHFARSFALGNPVVKEKLKRLKV